MIKESNYCEAATPTGSTEETVRFTGNGRVLRLNSFRCTTLLMMLAFIGPAHSTAQDSQTYFDEQKGTRRWSIPYAYTPGAEVDHVFYPDDRYDFTSALAMRFTPSIRGTLSNVLIYVDEVESSQPDSAIVYGQMETDPSTGDPQVKIPYTQQNESITGMAQRFTAPFSGSLKSFGIHFDDVRTNDGGNDSLEIGIYSRDLARAQQVSYWQSGTVWLFGVPNGTGTITGYGTRITAPASQADSVVLQGVDVYVFRINDNRFFNGYDTPSNDTLLVGIHSVSDAVGRPDSLFHTTKVPFSRIREGSDNRINFEGVRWPQGKDLYVTLETLRNGNADYLGLISGASLTPPINRSIVKENGNWGTISSSSSWGSGSAKGAELRITGIFEDPNAKTPDTQTPKGSPVRVAVSDLQSGANTIPINNIPFFLGEELWVTLHLVPTGTPDTLFFSTSPAEQSSSRNRVAARLTESGRTVTHSWAYLKNTTSFSGQNLNLTSFATFSGQTNDRLMLSLYSDEDQTRLPGQKVRDLEVPFYSLVRGEYNSIDVSEWSYETFADQSFHIAMSTVQIGETDGVILRSDQGDASRTQPRSSAFSTLNMVWGSVPARGFDAGSTVHFDWGIEIQQSTSTDGETDLRETLPDGFALESVYPNPFNPATVIRFRVETPLAVRLEVYDALGRRVAVLLNNEIVTAGEHSLTWQADGLGSGIYLLRMSSEAGVQSRTVTLLR